MNGLHIAYKQSNSWGHLDCNFVNQEEGKLKGFLMDKGNPENQPHEIIIAVNLTTVKFNGFLTTDFLKSQSKGE